CGISRETFLRLFWRAPSMRSTPLLRGGREAPMNVPCYPRCYHWRHMQDRIRALVVDDDADVRGLLTGVLTRNQMTVVEAASGREAMAVLGRDEFDVVLADVRLPDHSGLDILRWARGAEIDTEFIVLTGHADVDTAVEAM